jgi:hypothetical protein
MDCARQGMENPFVDRGECIPSGVESGGSIGWDKAKGCEMN